MICRASYPLPSPGVRDDTARDLVECLLDAVSLPGKTGLRMNTVKDEEKLREMMIDVLSLWGSSLSAINSYIPEGDHFSQGALESHFGGGRSHRGYLSILSQQSLDHFIALLQHLVVVASKISWEWAKQELLCPRVAPHPQFLPLPFAGQVPHVCHPPRLGSRRMGVTKAGSGKAQLAL